MMLKRLTGVIFIISLFFPAAAFGAASKVLNKTETPPAIEKGWNLVSTPCDISLSDFEQKNGFSDLEAYSWDGAQYQSVDTFERGKGYMINSNAVLNPSAVCDDAHPSDPITITLTQGWNLIGNPFHSSAKASDILGDSASVVSALYQLSGQKFAEMEINDNLKPWRGYWIYADEEATISTYNTCGLEIRAYKTESSTNALTDDPVKTTPTESLYLAAIYSCPAANNTITDLWDVTASASWTVSVPSVGSVSDSGVFTPASEGTTVVSAAYNEFEALKNIKVETVIANCANLILAMNPLQDIDGYYYYYYYSDTSSNYIYSTCNDSYIYRLANSGVIFDIQNGNDFSLEAYCSTSSYLYYDISYSSLTKVTNSVDWSIGDDSIIENKDGNAFTAVSTGNTTIQASYAGKKSGLLAISSSEFKLSYMSIKTTNADDAIALDYSLCNYSYCSGIESGKTIQLKATGKYRSDKYSYITSCDYSSSSSGYKDLSGATWSVSDESVATIDSEGNLTTLKAGYVTVTAKKDGISTSSTFRVLENHQVLAVSITPSNTLKLEPGDTTLINVYAYSFDPSASCSSTSSNYSYYDDYSSYYYFNTCKISKTDVTSDVAKWNYSNSSAGSISGGTFTAEAIGTTNITAEYAGLTSNSISIIVRKAEWMVLYVVGENSISCPDANCYYVKVGKSSNFIVYGYEEATILEDEQNITAKATWEVSDTSVATMDGATLTPLKRGMIWIRATVGDARSDKVWVLVTDSTSSEFIIIRTDSYTSSYKPIKPLKVGSAYKFIAYKYSFPGNDYSYSFEDITSQATWHLSDDSVATLTNSTYNVLVSGKAQGFTDVTATYNSMTSNAVTLDVWDKQNLAYCDSSNINSGEWSNNHSEAILETDCKYYKKGESVNIRYTASVDNESLWYLDNCLDLYILDERGDIVKTIREQGCSTESLKAMSKRSGWTDVYQYLAEWDMTNDGGATVATGKYYAAARFYILLEPVIRVPFTITD